MNWNDVFEYSGGQLIWKFRPPENFKTKSAFHNTNARFAGKVAGRVNQAKDCVKYVQIRYLGKIYYAHRIIWEMHYGKIKSGFFIDHIDGNGLNNKLDNIRLVTARDNAKNHPRPKNNKSGRIGVYYNKGAWLACIGINGKQEHLGSFKTIEEACAARSKAETKYNYHENHGRTQE